MVEPLDDYENLLGHSEQCGMQSRLDEGPGVPFLLEVLGRPEVERQEELLSPHAADGLQGCHEVLLELEQLRVHRPLDHRTIARARLSMHGVLVQEAVCQEGFQQLETEHCGTRLPVQFVGPAETKARQGTAVHRSRTVARLLPALPTPQPSSKVVSLLQSKALEEMFVTLVAMV